MIPVAIKGFNEIDALKVTIPQLIAIGVKEIVFFDGPFTEFKSEKDYSTDGTLEYLQNFDEITIIPCGRMNLMDKENKVFEVMASFNNVMILD